MVFHVGIDAWNGKVVAYNEVDKTSIEFYAAEIRYSYIDKIDRLFEEIKQKINGNLGCACIYLDWYYDNDTRKRIIQKGKEIGFLKVRIINSINLLCLEFILQSGYKPKKGDVIWIIWEKWCFIWFKRNTNIQLVGHFLKDVFSSTETFLKDTKAKLISPTSKKPNLLICESYKNINIKNVNSIFPECEIFIHQNYLSISEVALINARIMAEDSELLKYNAERHIEAYLAIFINGKNVSFFSRFESLSIKKYAFFPIENGTKKLMVTFKSEHFQGHNIRRDPLFPRFLNEVSHIFDSPKPNTQLRERLIYSEEIIVTSEMLEAGKIFLTFKIDENEISSVNYSVIVTAEKTECYFRDLYSNDTKEEKHLYDIPQKIETFNINISALGIDLGTSRCYAAVNRRGGIETVALDNTGERQLPSYVSFDEETPKCGKEVMRRLQNCAKSIVFDSKRIIGKNIWDIENGGTWPFEIKSVKNKLKITLQRNEIVLEKFPEEVAAVLLKHIKQKTDEFQGKPSHKVVITVPAAFAKNQKLATHVAGVFAGWIEVHLLPEPVAASIAYFIDRPIPNELTLLLFDLGGGTLDVCIFKIENNKLEIIGNTGDTNIGGRDFDQLLINYFDDILLSEYSVNVNEQTRLKFKLMQECMEIKHTLSVQNDASLHVGEFKMDNDDILKVTQQQFEEMSKKLLKKIKTTIQKSLEETNSVESEISKVLVAGGGSRMPMVQTLLKDTFPDAEYCQEENPDEVIAIGAAYYAYYLNSKDSQSSCTII